MNYVLCFSICAKAASNKIRKKKKNTTTKQTTTQLSSKATLLCEINFE